MALALRGSQQAQTRIGRAVQCAGITKVLCRRKGDLEGSFRTCFEVLRALFTPEAERGQGGVEMATPWRKCRGFVVFT